MRIPENVEVYQSEIATLWFDESGILCSFIKPIKPTLEKVQANYALIKKISPDKKVFLLSDTSNSRLLDDASANYVREEMPKIFEAIAVISSTAVGKANVVIFKNLHSQPIPINTFSRAHEAKAWLKEQMRKSKQPFSQAEAM